jgi:cell division protein FtsZ
MFDFDTVNEEEEVVREAAHMDSMISKIKVIGVGGAGCNAINRMITDGVTNVEFIAVNTDAQVLNASLAPVKLQIGKKITKGLGAGSKPEIGEKAAQEDIEEIRRLVSNADMVFITAGMGGGTGTGAAPIFAKIARDAGALTVAVVTVPFEFEGKTKIEIANDGISRLKDQVDTMLVISNSKVRNIIERRMSFKDAFKKLDDILIQAVQGISDIIAVTGVINVDFADVRTVLSNSGEAIMGIGSASGDNRVKEAVQMALENPLIQNSNFKSAGAGAMLANLIVGNDFSMSEYDEAGTLLREYCRGDVQVMKLGVHVDDKMRDRIKVVVLATGFQTESSDVSAEPIPAEEIFQDRKVIDVARAQQDRLNRFRTFQTAPAREAAPIRQTAPQEDYEVPAFLRRKKKMG